MLRDPNARRVGELDANDAEREPIHRAADVDHQPFRPDDREGGPLGQRLVAADLDPQGPAVIVLGSFDS